jgi:multimeric flavodoxin WrbA
MSSTKIFAVNSSPNGEKGNTARLLQAFLKGANKAGAETHVEYIFDQDIKPCTGCLSCWTSTPDECSQKDDMKKMLEKIKESDIVVYSTPLYVWDMNGTMKNFMDRLLPLSNPLSEIKNGIVRKQNRSDVKYSQVVLVSTCGLTGVHNFDSLVHLFETQCRFKQKEFSGALLRPNAGGLADSERAKAVYSAASEAGAQLVRDGYISPEILSRVSKQYASDEHFVESAINILK